MVCSFLKACYARTYALLVLTNGYTLVVHIVVQPISARHTRRVGPVSRPVEVSPLLRGALTRSLSLFHPEVRCVTKGLVHAHV